MLADSIRHIFVSTPLRPLPEDPDPKANVNFAAEICRQVVRAGGDPVAPHLYYPAFLDDDVPEDRSLGIQLGLLRLQTCDESWVVIPPWRRGLSSGMRDELEAAKAIGIPAHLIADVEGLEFHLERLRNGRVTLRFPTIPSGL